MKRTTLRVEDYMAQAAAILEASREKRGDGLRMEKVDNDDGPPPGPDDTSPGGGGGRGSQDPPEDDDDDEDVDDDDDDDDDSSDDKDDKSKKDDDDKVDRSEYDRVRRHRAAADRRVATLESENTSLKQQIASLKAEGKKEGEPDPAMTARVTDLEAKVTEKDQTIQRMRIENAFLASNTHDWVDPADALRLANLSDVEIEEDGTVVGLKEALNKLAREKPHLVRKKGDAPPKSSSGSSTNRKRKGDSKRPDRASLSRNYPILRTQ